uniref:DNA-dependent protein kinase catalytic subunit n=1 Tax=Cacopsylla melanoneura TaxID=428564 RepID=A0A8D8V9R5_9HEMI
MVLRHTAHILDVCMKGILSLSASSHCKSKCYACLEKIIPFLPFHPTLQIIFNAESFTNDIFKHLANARSKLSTTDVASIYALFGLLGKHFSNNLCAPDKIIRAICDELNSKEVKTGSISVKILESCLTALSNLLSNTELKTIISHGATYQNNIYTAIKCTLSPKQRVHTAFRACLHLFTNHTSLFSNLLIPEHQWWHTKFIELLSSFQGEEDRKIIVLAVDKFYVHVAKHVNENNQSSQSVAIYKYFMDYFDRELASQGSDSDTQTNITIKGLSQFVECNIVTSNEMSRSHLATMFYSFLQRTLFLSLELSKLEPNCLGSNARLVSCYLVLLSKLILQVTNCNQVSVSFCPS